MMPFSHTIESWTVRLHSAAALGPRGATISDPIASLGASITDELGHHRGIDPYLVGAISGKIPSTSAQTDDERLWLIACGGAGNVDDIVHRGGRGPLLRHAPETTIEVMTEKELAALHALWTVARIQWRPDLCAKCFEAAAWHMDELQPDNATHLPWAIHIFAILGVNEGRTDAALDAETRLHNALTGSGRGGRPDARSALILEHAARELDRFQS